MVNICVLDLCQVLRLGVAAPRFLLTSPTNMHTHTHTHYTRIHTNTHSQTLIHSHTHTTHTYTQTHTHTRTHTHKHTHTHTHTRAHTHTHTHTHTNTHTLTHTHTHTHIHTHFQEDVFKLTLPDVGTIKSLSLRTDKQSEKPSWCLDWAVIEQNPQQQWKGEKKQSQGIAAPPSFFVAGEKGWIGPSPVRVSICGLCV